MVTICTTSLTFNNSKLCFVIETQCIYCAVRANCSYLIAIFLHKITVAITKATICSSLSLSLSAVSQSINHNFRPRQAAIYVLTLDPVHFVRTDLPFWSTPLSPALGTQYTVYPDEGTCSTLRNNITFQTTAILLCTAVISSTLAFSSAHCFVWIVKFELLH